MVGVDSGEQGQGVFHDVESALLGGASADSTAVTVVRVQVNSSVTVARLCQILHGRATVTASGKTETTVDLLAGNAVDQAGFLSALKHAARNWPLLSTARSS